MQGFLIDGMNFLGFVDLSNKLYALLNLKNSHVLAYNTSGCIDDLYLIVSTTTICTRYHIYKFALGMEQQGHQKDFGLLMIDVLEM